MNWTRRFPAKRLVVFLFLVQLFILTDIAGNTGNITEAAAQPPAITVFLDEEILFFDVTPYLQAGRVLVPMQMLFERLGADVDWNSESQTIVAVKGDHSIEISIDSLQGKVNGVDTELSFPPIIKDGCIMVPLRFVSENLGTEVEWDAAAYAVIISQVAEPINPAVKATAVKSNVYVQAIIGDEYSYGSGVLLGRSGNVVTAYHVLDKFQGELRVYTEDGKSYGDAAVVGYDKNYDVAVFNINLAQDYDAPEVEFNESPRKGDRIFWVGNPDDKRNQVTEGKIINTQEIYFGNTYIECSPYTTSGSSGSGVYDRNGRLIGIASVSDSTTALMIPVSTISEVLKQNINISLEEFIQQDRGQAMSLRDQMFELQQKYTGYNLDTASQTLKLDYITGYEEILEDGSRFWEIELRMKEADYRSFRAIAGVKTSSEEIMQLIYNELKQKHSSIHIEMNLNMLDRYDQEPPQYVDASYIDYDPSIGKWVARIDICHMVPDENNLLQFAWGF